MQARTPKSVYFSPPSGPRLHVERYEAGQPTCVLIHGGGDGAFVWDLFAPVLARWFTTLAVDLRGHGDSGWGPPQSYRCESYVSDMRFVLDTSDSGELVLVGHSLGGQISTHLCSIYQKRVRACVFVDFAPTLSSEGMQQVRNLLNEGLKVYATVGEYADWLKRTRLLADPEVMDHLAGRALMRDLDSYRPKLDPQVATTFPDPTPAEVETLWRMLEGQQCPTLLIRGNGSAVLSRAVAKRMVRTLPHGELVTVDAAGHSVMLDNRQAFEAAVIEFLHGAISLTNRNSQEDS